MHAFDKTSMVPDVVVSCIGSSCTYKSRVIEREPIVTYGNEILVRDHDYTVAYQDNRNVGTATDVASLGSEECVEIAFATVSSGIVDAALSSIR